MFSKFTVQISATLLAILKYGFHDILHSLGVNSGTVP